MWNWYIAKEDELMVDLDWRHNIQRSRLGLSIERLAGAIESKSLAVAIDAATKKPDVFLWPSQTPQHYHLYIRLSEPMNAVGRLMWESYLCDDEWRSRMNHLRLSTFAKSISLLISPVRWPIDREPDATCICSSKHRPEIMQVCPVAQKHAGQLSPTFFGKRREIPSIHIGRIRL